MTFDSLEYWLRELRAYSSGVIVVVCGNKADAPARMRAVTTAAAADWAAAHGCEYFETSAKTGLNVEAAFTHIGASREPPCSLWSTSAHSLTSSCTGPAAHVALRQFRESVSSPTASDAGSPGDAAAYGSSAERSGGGASTGMAGAFRVISVERRSGGAAGGGAAGGDVVLGGGGSGDSGSRGGCC